jgi:hypothetical protein
MESYYPSTLRIIASLNLMYGQYLNEKPLEGIERLNKSLANPYISINNEFLGGVYALLIMAAIQASDLDSAKQYFYQAFGYQSLTNITILVPDLLEAIPQLKLCINTLGTDCARQFVGTGFTA